MASLINEYPVLKEIITTENMFLGLPEAEDEAPEKRGLNSFYEDVHDIVSKLEQETFIITGRKGCGKTAFVKYIEKKNGNNSLNHAKLFLPKDYDLEKLIQNVSEKGDSKYKLLYEWIILVCFAEMILEVNKSSFATAIKELEKFWKLNSGHLSVSKLLLEGVETESNGSYELGLFDRIKLFCSRSAKKNYKRPDYTQLIGDLRKKVNQALNYQLHEGHAFYLFFDDLDEEFDVNNVDDCKRILALINVSKLFNSKFLSGSKGKVVVMIREDLLDKMSGIDTSYTKTIVGCSFSLRWYDPIDDNSDEKKLMLRKLLNKRLAANFNKLEIDYNHDDPWITFVDNTEKFEYNYKTAFKYILGFTQCRPRDFLYIFNKIGDHKYQLPLNDIAIKKLLTDYVDIAYNESRDELVGVLKDRTHIDSLLSICESFLSVEDFSFRQLSKRLSDKGFQEVEKYVRLLINYNIIIPIKNDKELPHYLYPKWCGQYKDFRYKLPIWLKTHYDDRFI